MIRGPGLVPRIRKTRTSIQLVVSIATAVIMAAAIMTAIIVTTLVTATIATLVTTIATALITLIATEVLGTHITPMEVLYRSVVMIPVAALAVRWVAATVAVMGIVVTIDVPAKITVMAVIPGT